MIICHSNVDDTITSCLVRVLLIQYMYTVLTSNDADNKILMRPSHSGGSGPSDKGGVGAITQTLEYGGTPKIIFLDPMGLFLA